MFCELDALVHQQETHHTACQSPGLIKAHNVDICSFFELDGGQDLYAPFLELESAGAVGAYDHSGNRNWCC